MKVLFFSHSNKLSGGERSLLDVISGLKDRMEVFLTVPGEGALSRVLREMGIRVFTFPPARIFSIRREEIGLKNLVYVNDIYKICKMLIEFIRRERIDVLYTNSQKAHIIGAILKMKMPRLRLIWHFRDILEGKAKLLMNALSFIPDKIISISKSVDKQFLKRTDVVYNAIEIPGKINRLKLEGTFKIGYVAQIARWKGQHHFIKVLSMVNERGVKGYILGGAIFAEEYYQREIENLIKAEDLENKVEILGWKENVYDYFSSFDLLVHLPEKPEPFGRVVVEAMALGIPVVAHNSGALKEVIGDAGIVVDYKKFDEVAYWIRRLKRDKILYNRLRERGYERYRKMFTKERLLRDIEERIFSISRNWRVKESFLL